MICIFALTCSLLKSRDTGLNINSYFEISLALVAMTSSFSRFLFPMLIIDNLDPDSMFDVTNVKLYHAAGCL